ncbi:MAG: hypothetical protein K5686_04435 [Lachnospiraceae bacterium]|nr:hypothetical protein [Lachnospiraceae bacterium]
MAVQKKNTLLFILIFIAAGLVHILEDFFHNVPEPDYSLVTFIFCLMLIVYPLLLLFWILSIRTRLLPSRSRSYMFAAALLMILYLCLRAFRYRIADSAIGLRYGWYAYYVPMILMPTLFMMVCIRSGRGANTKFNERLLLIPAVLLAAVVMTNDLHHAVFVPKPDTKVLIGSGGTYTYTFLFYMIYAWIILSIIIGVALLLKECGRGHDKKTMTEVIAVIVVWMILLQLHNLKRSIEFIPPWETPELNIFSIIAIFEICIRERLIPYNENYPGFFSKLPMPVMITDKAYEPVYRSAGSMDPDREQLEDALKASIYIEEELKLSGKSINGGFAFWIEDESEVIRANEMLKEANELLESENTLIEYENKQKEENAYVSSRHHIYHDIAEKMYPYQKRIRDMLSDIKPGDPDFREAIAYVSVLNAYVKRKTNFLLLASEADKIAMNELYLAISESGRYLSYVGLKTSVEESGTKAELPAEALIALYDSFEILAEGMIGEGKLLMVSFTPDGLKLACDIKKLPPAEVPAYLETNISEDILYITLRIPTGGEAG